MSASLQKQQILSPRVCSLRLARPEVRILAGARGIFARTCLSSPLFHIE
jgi:hypothetical protein